MSLVGLLVESTVKVSLVVLAALAATACLRRRSAALRHWVLSAAIVAATVGPVLGIVMPSWHVPLDAVSLPRLMAPAASSAVARTPPRSSAAAQSVSPADAPGTGVGAVLATAWIVGAGVSVLILFIGLGRLGWIASSARRVARGRWTAAAEELSREYGLRRPVVILQSDHPALLVTWGFVQPKVILPLTAEDWTEARIRVVLSHELAHVKRGDWLIQMAAELARSVYWFNPLMWIVCRRLRQESEQATDDVVMGVGMDGSDYAAHLVDLARVFARHRPWLPAPAIARPSSLERRITAMLNAHVNRAPITSSTRLGVVAALSALAIAVASAQGAFSTFSGTVFDPQNGYLPGVTMTLTNTQSGAKYEIRSDRTGHFEFVGLPPGQYSLVTTLPGFVPLSGTLDVTGGQNVQRDVTLKVGELHETIMVRGGGTTSAAPAPTRRAAPPAFAAMNVCSDVPAAGGMGGNLRQPTKLVDVKPRYPSSLAGTSGLVELDARIGTDGTIHEIQTASATHPEFDFAARDAVQQWQFSQTLLNCVPIEVAMRVTIRFQAE
jgi:TonB family protein